MVGLSESTVYSFLSSSAGLYWSVVLAAVCTHPRSSAPKSSWLEASFSAAGAARIHDLLWSMMATGCFYFPALISHSPASLADCSTSTNDFITYSHVHNRLSAVYRLFCFLLWGGRRRKTSYWSSTFRIVYLWREIVSSVEYLMPATRLSVAFIYANSIKQLVQPLWPTCPIL